MADIIYNVDNLKKAKKSIDDLIDTLDTDNKKLSENLAQLKKEWNTGAGKKFFKDHKDTWSEYVKKYVKKLTGISDMLQKAIDEYGAINNEVKNLRV